METPAKLIEHFIAAFEEPLLRARAGERAYQLGLEHFDEGHVTLVADSGDRIEAVVSGAADYTVRMTVVRGKVEHDCRCPSGLKGQFCKHCVAAALAWKARPRAGKKAELTVADAARLLLEETPETAARMLTDWAGTDDRLRERLLTHAAYRTSPAAGAKMARRAFEKAVYIRDYVDYREAYGWASDVSAAIDNFDQLMKAGQAAPAIELCEWALKQLVEACGQIDDSDGQLTDLRDRIEEIHLRACEAAKPDPDALARSLFHTELEGGDLDLFSGAAQRYAKVLGKRGLAVFRELAEAEWEKVPVRKPGSQSDFESPGRFRIGRIMESLARASGDVDELATVISRDLSHSYSFLRIAEAYRDARQFDKALDWAERGLAAFPKTPDPRLRDLAAEEFHRRKQHDKAMDLMWATFLERPYLDTFQKLLRHAVTAGKRPEWCNRALTEIRGRIARGKADHSLLVEIFLDEGDDDLAWREAQSGGCSNYLWLRLADKRQQALPADAAPVYLRLAVVAVSTERGSRYENAVELLVKAAAAMQRIGESRQFLNELEALRARYKIKRNFTKLLDKHRNQLHLS